MMRRRFGWRGVLYGATSPTNTGIAPRKYDPLPTENNATSRWRDPAPVLSNREALNIIGAGHGQAVMDPVGSEN